MSDNGSVYTCKHHPNLRWFDTKPGGRLLFVGEIPTAEHPTGRPDWMGGIPHMKVLKARMEGKNPYFPSMDDPDGPSITTFEQVVEFVDYCRSMEERWAFECECPASDLVNLTKETGEVYEDKIAQIDLPPR